MLVPDTRISLLQRLHDRDDSPAWVEFCEIYERAIYRLALQYGLQDADAREVSQEVLLSVSRRIHLFDVEGRGTFRAWLATIARHATIDQLRKNRRRPTEDLPDESLLASSNRLDDSQRFDSEVRREQFRWATHQVQANCEPKTWQAFWNTAIEGQAPEAVAKQLHMSVGSVYVARCRTLAKIKSLIEPFREEPT